MCHVCANFSFSCTTNVYLEHRSQLGQNKYTTWTKGVLGLLAGWHLPGGPVGPASRWAATSNVEVAQTPYPVNRERVVRKGRKWS